MKTSKVSILLALIFVGVCGVCFATVRTLNNNVPSPGQFTTYVAAETASATGDTIYVSGSATSYGNITMNKSLTLIGTGHNPNKQNALVSTFGTISMSGSATGSKFIGLTAGTIITTSSSINSVLVSRCSISAQITVGGACNSWTIESNLFTSSAVDMAANGLTASTVRNNIFNGQIIQLNGGQITNNLFIGTGAAFAPLVAAVSIFDNIFYRANPTGQNTNCTTSFNCSFPLTNTFSDDDGNNLLADPLFINFPSAGALFSYSFDFRLQSGSPCITNLGLSGTQRGLYGGGPTLPFTMTGEPPIPQIRAMSASPTTVPVGTNVNVNVISTTK